MDKSHFKFAYKLNENVFVPSEKLLSTLPGRTFAEKRINQSVWVKEFAAMMKYPKTYYKVHGPNSWDFDTLMDYVHSYYIIEKIPSTFCRALDLAAVGVGYNCSCPQYMHYHYCKHSIGYAVSQGGATVPNSFATAIVGKRKAPEGAKRNKRAHCLMIEN